MKKFTLLSLIIFLAIVGGIFVYSTTYSPTQNQENMSNSDMLTNQSPGKNQKTLQTFTAAEVALHNTRDDCYLIINNKVYDVSSYIGIHPGGAREITSRCGQEVTGIFAQIHSNQAWDLLAAYKIGVIAPSK